MPLRWIICPVSHECMEIPDCLSCAQHYTGQPDPTQGGKRRLCNFRPPYLKRMTDHAEGRADAGLSATMVTGCLRKAWWQYRQDYAQYPLEVKAATDGTAWHEYMAGANEETCIGEQRFYHRLPSGRVISGQLDRLVEVHAGNCLVPESLWPVDEDDHVYLIEDYKTKDTGHVFTQAPTYYTLQLNIYRLMIERGSVIDRETGEQIRGRVVGMYLLPGSHSEQGKIVPVDRLPEEEIETFLEECYDLWEAAENYGELPPRDTDDPDRSPFCPKYCPLRSQCKAVGGTAYHPSWALIGAPKKKVRWVPIPDDTR